MGPCTTSGPPIPWCPLHFICSLLFVSTSGTSAALSENFEEFCINDMCIKADTYLTRQCNCRRHYQSPYMHQIPWRDWRLTQPSDQDWGFIRGFPTPEDATQQKYFGMWYSLDTNDAQYELERQKYIFIYVNIDHENRISSSKPVFDSIAFLVFNVLPRYLFSYPSKMLGFFSWMRLAISSL